MGDPAGEHHAAGERRHPSAVAVGESSTDPGKDTIGARKGQRDAHLQARPVEVPREQDRRREHDRVEGEVARGDSGVRGGKGTDLEEPWLEDWVRVSQLPANEHGGENEQHGNPGGEREGGVRALDDECCRASENCREQGGARPVERGLRDDAGRSRYRSPGEGESGRDEGDIDEEDRPPAADTDEDAADQRAEPRREAIDPPTSRRRLRACPQGSAPG